MIGKLKVLLITMVLVVTMFLFAGHEYTKLTAALDLNTKENNLMSKINNMIKPTSATSDPQFTKNEGVNDTDGYVQNNWNYKGIYTSTLNNYIKYGKGYVSLSRILYFYNENPNLSFNEIYSDNLDYDKSQKMISDVCSLDKYKNMSVCSESSINSSNQADYKQSKVFNPPLDLANMHVSSFFMENRSYENHKAWDFAAPSGTKVYSVCEGTVTKVDFRYSQNVSSSGYGNNIVIQCSDSPYTVLYAHLYPGSNQVSVGDKVNHYTHIAGVGTTGYSTGPHLHFQVQDNNSYYVDGMSLIKY